jgi:ssDNA-binding Zn-finger/Zn-ribbon topoisomerase 1
MLPIRIPNSCPDCGAELVYYTIDEMQHMHVNGTRNESATYACDNTVEYRKNFQDTKNHNRCKKAMEAIVAKAEIEAINKKVLAILKKTSDNVFVQEHVEKIKRWM